MAIKKISAKQIWEQSVKAKAREIMVNCKTDTVLTQQLDSMIIKIDTDIINKRHFNERIQGILDVISSKTYYENAHKSSSDLEIKAIKSFAEDLALLYKQSSYEASQQPIEEEEQVKIKERLPNQFVDIDKVYGPAEKYDKVE